MKSRNMLSIGLTAAMLTACGHAEKESAKDEPSAAGGVAAVAGEAANPGAGAEVDACKLISKEEAATVLDNPGPAVPGDSGITKDCTYSRDEDHLSLAVNVLPADKANMATYQAIYDPKDIIPLPGVGDVAFEFFQNREEIRYQSRIIVGLKGSTRFTLNLYRKTGEVGEPFNAKLVAIAKAVADRL
jgi:hypothetical protein